MHMFQLFILCSSVLITGCSSTVNTQQNKMATKTVTQVNQSSVEHPSIETLSESFVDKNSSSPFSGTVVELTGKVVAFALTNDSLYTVTIRNGDSEVICVFDDSIAGNLGDGRDIHDGATVTVRGQCFASGLFSSTSFSLDGCRIVSK